MKDFCGQCVPNHQEWSNCICACWCHNPARNSLNAKPAQPSEPIRGEEVWQDGKLLKPGVDYVKRDKGIELLPPAEPIKATDIIEKSQKISGDWLVKGIDRVFGFPVKVDPTIPPNELHFSPAEPPCTEKQSIDANNMVAPPHKEEEWEEQLDGMALAVKYKQGGIEIVDFDYLAPQMKRIKSWIRIKKALWQGEADKKGYERGYLACGKEEYHRGFSTAREQLEALKASHLFVVKADGTLEIEATLREARAAAIREERERVRKMFSDRFGMTISPADICFQEEYFKKSDVLALLELMHQEDEA